MGKLVLLLEDGTTQDLLLRRERITIGRRPDNDVCLPHPAVSGEHAAVTTILSDSFLEDLGSTNGTHVNGSRVQKHFLRDGDLIEVGRQRLLYYLDDRAQPAVAARARSEAAPGEVSEQGAATLADTRAMASLAEARGRAEAHPGAHSAIDPPRGNEEDHGVGAIVETPTSDRWSQRGAGEATGAPELVVLTGPRAGRSIALVKDVTSVGRAGVQVALVRRTAEGYLLAAAEGSAPPERNGVPVDASGALLDPGDVIEVAGARIEFSAPPDLPT